MRHVLKEKFEKFTKPDPGTDWLWQLLNRFLGKGIFTSQHGRGAADGGAAWLRQRKIATNIFNHGNFNNNMARVFEANAEQLKDCLQPGQKEDMQLHFFNFTMDSIVKIFFGEESGTVVGEANKFGKFFDEAHRSFFEYFLNSVTTISIVGHMLPWPFGGGEGLAMWLYGLCSRDSRKFASNLAHLDAESARIIDRCRQDPRLAERTDLLALFLQAEQGEGAPCRGSTRHLRDVVLNFVIAGRDTTACALSWMFYILSTHPDVQSQVSEEIDRCVPKGNSPTPKALQPKNMPCLNALIYETLRLYPPVPINLKDCFEDDVLPNGTFVPAGTKLLLSIWSMGRDPAVYPEPEKVLLERWIPFKQPQPHEFPVFQAGPRICIGMEMAIFEAKLVACILLREFSFTMAPGEQENIHYSRTITMSVCNSKQQDSHHLWLIPRRRDGGTCSQPDLAGLEADAPTKSVA